MDGAAAEGFVEVNGARLWYEIGGSGPALVMLHGLIDSGQWDAQFAEFAHEFRVVRYDARGFGRLDQPAGPFAFHDDLSTLLDPPAISRLGEIRVPALVIVGGDDWAPIHEVAQMLAEQIPGAWKVVIPDAGHHPNIEHPAAFNELVLGLLRSIKEG